MLWRAVQALALAALLGPATSCNPVHRVQARLELKNGNLSYLKHDYLQAIGHYDAALQLVPGLTMAHLNRAYSYVSMLRTAIDPHERRRFADEAVRSFQAFLGATPAPAPADGGKGPSRARIEQQIVTLYIDTQQTHDAVTFLTAKLAQAPNDAATLQMLATIEAERGNLDAALEWHRKHVVAAPKSPEARYALGAFIWQRSYRNPVMDAFGRTALLDEGLAVLAQAVELRPDYFDALVYVNLLYREKAKYAATDAERAGFLAQAKTWFDRANVVRGAAADSLPPGTPPATPGAR